MTTEYFAVYRNEDQPADRPSGLYRRVYDDSGRGVGDDAYHPRTGWHLTDYWLRIGRGEPDRHLVPVDEQPAQQLQQHFDRIWAEREG